MIFKRISEDVFFGVKELANNSLEKVVIIWCLVRMYCLVSKNKQIIV